MLAKITGIIFKKFPDRLLLEIAPLIFEVFIPFSLYEHLPREGESVSLYVVLRLRADSFELYGFGDWESRQLFEKLQRISNVGPRLALNILSVFNPEEFCQIIRETDIERLSQVPGIGPKRAERLCVELRSRLERIGSMDLRKEKLFEEAVSALVNLGFSIREATSVLKEVYHQDEDVVGLIRKALKRFSGEDKGA